LYYVRFVHAGEKRTPTWVDSGGLPTIEAAMTVAQQKVPAPIEWTA
jgi:hypothetical protein